MKALIVDDEMLVRKGLSMSIDWHSLGFDRVYEASNGEEALKLLRTEDITFMLTDIVMPRVDGLELIKSTSKLYPEIKTVVLSCLNDGEVIREAMKFNRALDFIPKLSVSTEELREIIKSAMSSNRHKVGTAIVNTEVMSSESRFNIDLEEELRENLILGNKSKVRDTIKSVFYGIDCNQPIAILPEWIEVYASLNHVLKRSKGDLIKIKIEGLSCYDYLAESKSIGMLKHRIIQLSELVIEYVARYRIDNYGKDISKAILYIEGNYSTTIKLTDVANHIGMNGSYLSTLFKNTVGISFSDYINKTRLEHAKRMLLESDAPIVEIALDVGYSSESYFSRIFKQFEKVSPNTYRKQKRSK